MAARPQLLLVDADARSLRLLEVSLRKAGFTVIAACNGADALEKLEQVVPDLVLSDTRMPEMDGWELCRRLKEDPRFREVPFVFLTSRRAVEDKVRGLELGVDDYLTKPIYVKEIVARVRMLLQKRERERLERRDPRSGFSGNLADLGLVDLVQTCEIGRKTGMLRCVDKRGRRGAVYFRDGKVIDAEMAGLRGEHAFYRLLEWSEGSFEIEFGPVERADAIAMSAQGLLMEGMRRADEWSRLLETAPPLDAVLSVDPERLASIGTGVIPEAAAPLLPLLDGKRTLQAALEEGARDDLAALGAVIELVGKGVLVAAAQADGPAPQEQAWFVPPVSSSVEARPAVEEPRPEASAEPSGVFDFPAPAPGPRWGASAAAPAAVAPAAVAAAQAAPVEAPAPVAPVPIPAVPKVAPLPPPPQLRLVEFEQAVASRSKLRWVVPLLLLVALVGLLALVRLD
ncbi:response regulator [Vulgatibacter sp.]|uniref:response regulator n=1 Tax=Vulgatibacter sp. TaxID=1971226 RepID=UPI0035689F54